MQDRLSVILFGWPALTGSLLLTIVGLVARKTVLVAIGAALLVPFSLFLGRTFPPVLSLPFFHFGSAAALWRGRVRLAWLLLIPLALLLVVLLVEAQRV
jgi:hypothetical protein